MKKTIFLLLIAATYALSASPKKAADSNVPPEYKDARDGQIYKVVKIGDQVWMAENLKFNAPESFCYEDRYTVCKTNGRLYTWLGAMDIKDKYKGERYTSKLKKKHQGVCPTGWHIPTNAEWEALAKAVEGVKDTCNENDVCAWKNVGKALKATAGWENEDGDTSNGENTSGFAAMPSGHKDMLSNFEGLGTSAMYWSVDEGIGNEYDAYRWAISDDMLYFDAGYKNEAYSVRCIRNF